MAIDARRIRTLAVTAAPIVAATAVLCWGVLSHDGLPDGYSVAKHASWARSFVESLSAGVVYPRWVMDINRGLGGPTFVFYGPLGYYLLAAVNSVVGNLILSFRLTIALGALLAGWSMFSFARSFSSRTWASVAGALYVLMPYAADDLYHRFDFAELLAFVWVPLVFLATRRLAGEVTTKEWVVLAVSYAGLVLTHIVTAFLVLFVVGPYAVVLAVRQGTWRRSLPAIVTAGFVGTLCAGAYLVPALVERSYSHMESMLEARWERWNRAMLFRPPYRLATWKRRPRQVLELVALVQGVVAWTAALIVFLRDRSTGRASRETERWLVPGLWLWTLFLMVPLSSFIWRSVPELPTVQYPTRFLLFNAMLTAAMVAAIGSREDGAAGSGFRRGSARAPRSRTLQPISVALILGLAAVPAVGLTVSSERAASYSFTSAVATIPENAMVVVSEYIPKIVPDYHSIEKMSTDRWRARLDPPGSTRVTEWKPEHRTIVTSSSAPATLRLRTFDYPGWRAVVDGRPTPIAAEFESGSIEVRVPPGTHQVDVRFTSTPDRRIGAAASLVGLFVIVGVAVKGRLKGRFEAND